MHVFLPMSLLTTIVFHTSSIYRRGSWLLHRRSMGLVFITLLAHQQMRAQVPDQVLEPFGATISPRLLGAQDPAPRTALCRAVYMTTKFAERLVITAHGAHDHAGAVVRLDRIESQDSDLLFRLTHEISGTPQGVPEPFAISIVVTAVVNGSSVVRIIDAAGEQRVKVDLRDTMIHKATTNK